MKNLLCYKNKITNYYLHIPFCLKKCTFCAFPVMAVGNQNHNQAYKQTIYNQYVKTIIKEIQFYQQYNKFNKDHPAQTLYIGGGTPSLLQPQQINKILSQIKIDDNTQLTLQMNPEQISKLRQFQKKAHINRFSIGIQTFNNHTLKQFNRNTLNQKQRIFYQQLRDFSVTRDGNLNVDFIIDFNTDQKDRNKMIEFIKQIRPKHLTMYNLQINPGSHLYNNLNQYPKKYQQNDKLSNKQYESYLEIYAKLEQMGYKNYQISNFAVDPQYQSKHNKVYWKGDQDFAAFGMGATNLVNNLRISRPKTVTKYYKFIELLQKQDYESAYKLCEINNETDSMQKIKWIILSQIRTQQGVKITEVLQKIFNNNKYNIVKLNQLIIKNLQQINKLRNQEFIIIGVNGIGQIQIKMKFPEGGMVADQIGYQIIDIIQQWVKNQSIKA